MQDTNNNTSFISTGSGKFDHVSRHKPCPKCGATKNCRTSNGGKLVHCKDHSASKRTVERGESGEYISRGTDGIGFGLWALNERQHSKTAYVPMHRHDKDAKKIEIDAQFSGCMDGKAAHKLWYTQVSEFLAPKHQEELIARGLSLATIREWRVGSTSYRNSADGIRIPIADIDGYMRGAQKRNDNKDYGKYIWLGAENSKHLLELYPSLELPSQHVATSNRDSKGVNHYDLESVYEVVITEGVLKPLVAFSKHGNDTAHGNDTVMYIGYSGGNTCRQQLANDLAKLPNLQRVTIAPDAGCINNKMVAKSILKQATLLTAFTKNTGIEVAILDWGQWEDKGAGDIDEIDTLEGATPKTLGAFYQAYLQVQKLTDLVLIRQEIGADLDLETLAAETLVGYKNIPLSQDDPDWLGKFVTAIESKEHAHAQMILLQLTTGHGKTHAVETLAKLGHKILYLCASPNNPTTDFLINEGIRYPVKHPDLVGTKTGDKRPDGQLLNVPVKDSRALEGSQVLVKANCDKYYERVATAVKLPDKEKPCEGCPMFNNGCGYYKEVAEYKQNIASRSAYYNNSNSNEYYDLERKAGLKEDVVVAETEAAKARVAELEDEATTTTDTAHGMVLTNLKVANYRLAELVNESEISKADRDKYAKEFAVLKSRENALLTGSKGFVVVAHHGSFVYGTDKIGTEFDFVIVDDVKPEKSSTTVSINYIKHKVITALYSAGAKDLAIAFTELVLEAEESYYPLAFDWAKHAKDLSADVLAALTAAELKNCTEMEYQGDDYEDFNPNNEGGAGFWRAIPGSEYQKRDFATGEIVNKQRYVPESQEQSIAFGQIKRAAKANRSDARLTAVETGTLGNFFKLISEDPTCQILVSKTELTVTKVERPLLNNLRAIGKKIVISDATAIPTEVASLWGIPQSRLLKFSSTTIDNSNLEIVEMLDVGNLNKSSDEQIGWQLAVLATSLKDQGLEPAIIANKEFMALGLHVMRERSILLLTAFGTAIGSNSAKEATDLIIATGGRINIGALKQDYTLAYGLSPIYVAINRKGERVERYTNHFEQYRKKRDTAVMMQSIGRLRHNRRPGENLKVYIGDVACAQWVAEQLPGAKTSSMVLADTATTGKQNFLHRMSSEARMLLERKEDPLSDYEARITDSELTKMLSKVTNGLNLPELTADAFKKRLSTIEENYGNLPEKSNGRGMPGSILDRWIGHINRAGKYLKEIAKSDLLMVPRRMPIWPALLEQAAKLAGTTTIVKDTVSIEELQAAKAIRDEQIEQAAEARVALEVLQEANEDHLLYNYIDDDDLDDWERPDTHDEWLQAAFSPPSD